MSKTQSNPLIKHTAKLDELVTEAVNITTTSKKRSQILAAFCSAYEQVESVSAAVPKKVQFYSESKKSIKTVSNVLGGAIDGLEASDITLSELRSLSKQLLDEIMPTLMEKVELNSAQHLARTKPSESVQEQRKPANASDQITEKLVIALNDDGPKVHKAFCQTKTFKDALADAIKGIKLGNDERIESDKQIVGVIEDNASKDAVRAYLKSLAAMRANIPVTAGKAGFNIVRLPVVPVFEAITRGSGQRVPGAGMAIKGQPNPSAVLKQTGIRSVPVEEYMIIQDQLLLVIDKNNLPEKEVVKSTKSGRIHKSQVPMTPYDYAKTVLSVIESSTGKSYACFDDKPLTNPRKSNLLMYWIMAEKTVVYLKRKGFPKILNWGLPF